jgi:nucleoside-diphosphate-sugar epimerase
MFTILGAGGVIGNELVKELSTKGKKIRLVSRTVISLPGASEAIPADLSDANQTIKAVSDSEVVFLVAGLKYNLKFWRELWPKIMQNTIEACKKANAKLIFLDNVYMYGKVNGPMTEQTPFHPSSKKGEVRAEIATMLLNEIKQGNLTACIARSADFYGPKARTSVVNILVFDKFAKNSKAAWLINDSVRHSFTFTPDAGKSLMLLAESDKAWNQTWHIPTASDAPTGKQFIEMAAKEFGVEPKYRILSRPMIKIGGFFDSDLRDVYEMLYQNESEYVFDSTKFESAFEYKTTEYSDGIKQTAVSCRS